MSLNEKSEANSDRMSSSLDQRELPEAQDRALLECRSIERRFGGLVAVTGVDMNIMPGEIFGLVGPNGRSEEHTSELQSLMRISYAVFCLKKKKKINKNDDTYKITTNNT